FPPRRHDADSAPVALLWPATPGINDRAAPSRSGKRNERQFDRAAFGACGIRLAGCKNRQEPTRYRRTQALARQGAPEICGFATVSCLRATTLRSASSALCAATSNGFESER